MSTRESVRRRSTKPPRADAPATDDERLDEALKETFPASDPPAPTHPDITGWDLDDKKADQKRRKR